MIFLERLKGGPVLNTEATEVAESDRFACALQAARALCHHFGLALAPRGGATGVILRKGYGLGAMGMTAGGFHAPLFTVAWPTGEFGAMGLEGAVRLGYRKELEALPDGPQRQALFEELLARQVANGSAVQMATTLEVDAVIDPADTRHWLAQGLASARTGTTAPSRFIDTW